MIYFLQKILHEIISSIIQEMSELYLEAKICKILFQLPFIMFINIQQINTRKINTYKVLYDIQRYINQIEIFLGILAKQFFLNTTNMATVSASIF